MSTYTDNGDTIRREAVAPPVHGSWNRVSIAELWVDLEGGVGLVDDQGSDPKIMLDWSSDGGHTWSDEVTASIGKMGEYKARAVWRRLGQSRNRYFRIAISDPVKTAIIAAHVKANVRA